MTLPRWATTAMAWCAVVGFTGETRAEGPGYRYRYVSLTAAVPAGFDPDFSPVRITEDRDVYGNLFVCGPETCLLSAGVYRNGRIAVLQEGLVLYAANERGKLAGSVLTDPVNFVEQAALVERGQLRILPRLPGEATSRVVRLNDSGTALVQSQAAAEPFSVSYYLYARGRVTPLELGSEQLAHLDMNDRLVISGTRVTSSASVAFRFVPPRGPTTLLLPVPPDTRAEGRAINRHGDVLGYSYTGGTIERIGVWRGRKFRTYFIQDTPEFPERSNRLMWNERGLIVISFPILATTDTSFIVPRPGVRIDLADVTVGEPVALTYINDLNERGDLVGFGSRGDVFDSFLLRRVGRGRDVRTTSRRHRATRKARRAKRGRGARQR
jgi:hypothetical protein